MHVKWMFHATAMVADYDAAVGPLTRLFGCRVLHDNTVEDEGIGRRGGMTWIGDGSIEVGEPVGPRSPVRKFVESFGGGMHSVALQVDDIDAAKAHLAALGAGIASEPYDGMVWTRPADTAGILLEWYSLEQEDDPRWGAPVPDPLRGSAGAVSPAVSPAVRLAYVSATVDDPTSSAARLAELMRTRWWPLDDCDDLKAAVSLGDCTLVLRAASGERPRVHGVGLQVESLDGAERALASEGVRTERRWNNVLDVDTRAVPFPVTLTEALLPGDPRS